MLFKKALCGWKYIISTFPGIFSLVKIRSFFAGSEFFVKLNSTSKCDKKTLKSGEIEGEKISKLF